MSDDEADKTSKFLASIGINDDPIISGKPADIVLREEPVTEVAVIDEPDLDQSVTNDFTLARQNILDTTDKLKDAMAELLPIAKQSQHPRAFEVFGALAKTVLEAQQDLMDLHKKKEVLKPGSVKQDDTPTTTTQTQNNIFVGSSADLQRMIENMVKK